MNGKEALKDLEKEIQFHYRDIDVYNITKYPEEIHIIEQALDDKEKFEDLVGMDLDLFMKAVNVKGLLEDYQRIKEVLEIIIKKRVNLFVVAHCDSKEAYNDMVSEHYRELTETEFNSIKEVLK